MASERKWLQAGYKGLSDVGHFVSHLLLLVVRLYWGALLVKTGVGKWINAADIAEFFSEINIPYPYFSAFFVGLFEILGGISLFLGLFARIFAIPVIIILATAYWTAHYSALTDFFVNPALFLSEPPFLFLYAVLLVFCFGPGAISLDYFIEKKAYGHRL